jgi:rhamnose transport system permease protein
MPRLRRPGFAYWHELVLLALIAGLLVYAAFVSPDFLKWNTQLALSRNIWERAILALPMTLIIITAGIDLSVGAAVALSSVMMGVAFRAGAPMPLAIGVALFTGLACGLLNGVFVALVRVHPLIVTLATLSAYRGFAEGISHGASIKGFPSWFAKIAGNVAGVPIPGIIFVIAAIFTAIVLAKTPFGRAVYAIGYNETACRFSGIATRRIKLTLYTLSGLAAGVAAVVYGSRVNNAAANQGESFELDVVTAVVLGGASVFGGRGRILGTVLGLLLIHETQQFVRWRWNDETLINLVVGTLLIFSVLLNTLLTPRGRE